MSDKLTPAQRSRCMSRIHGKDTKPPIPKRKKPHRKNCKRLFVWLTLLQCLFAFTLNILAQQLTVFGEELDFTKVVQL